MRRLAHQFQLAKAEAALAQLTGLSSKPQQTVAAQPRCIHTGTMGAADCVFCGPWVARLAEATAERNAARHELERAYALLSDEFKEESGTLTQQDGTDYPMPQIATAVEFLVGAVEEKDGDLQAQLAAVTRERTILASCLTLARDALYRIERGEWGVTPHACAALGLAVSDARAQRENCTCPTPPTGMDLDLHIDDCPRSNHWHPAPARADRAGTE